MGGVDSQYAGNGRRYSKGTGELSTLSSLANEIKALELVQLMDTLPRVAIMARLIKQRQLYKQVV
ncbi:hypothetical protein ACTXT7_010589 [Hymenolepis weldensis]